MTPDFNEYEQCFVYIQGNKKDIEKYYELVRLSKDDKLILYPERGLSFVDQVCYIPYEKSILTENPWLISTYSRKSVWILENGKWINPEMQTYGASQSLITMNILNYPNTLPLLPYGGRKGIEDYKEKVINQQWQ